MSYREFLRRLLTIVLLALLLLGMWHLRRILLLGFLAVVVAVAISVPAGKLMALGLSRGMANTLVGIGAAVLTVGLGFWILPTLVIEAAELVAAVPQAVIETETAYEDWRVSDPRLQALLPTFRSDEFEEAQETLGIIPRDMGDLTVRFLNSALPLVQGIGNRLLTALTNLAIVLFVSIFFLVDPLNYLKASMMLVPRENRERVLEIWGALYRTLTTWITAQAISIIITVLLVWIILGAFLGLPHALPVALLAGLATFIPNIGAFLPLIPIVIFTVADDPSQLLVLVPAYLLIQFLESNVLTPTIVRNELNIPSGGVLLFQVISATLFGALGLLLAVPLLAVIITLVREIYSFDILGWRQQPFSLVLDPGGQVRITDRAGTPAPVGAGVEAETAPLAPDASLGSRPRSGPATALDQEPSPSA